MLVSVPVRSINWCQISLAVWYITTTEMGLGNSLVLLLPENIAATHNKHAWETGKPKNVEISAHLGLQKVALKSICTTFSSVTPFFNWFLKSWCQVQLENAIYSKFYLINFEYHEFFYRFTKNRDCDFEHTSEVRGLVGGGRGDWKRAVEAIHSKPDFLQRHCQLFYQFCWSETRLSAILSRMSPWGNFWFRQRKQPNFHSALCNI